MFTVPKGLMKHKERIITTIAIIGFVLGGVHFMFKQQARWLEAHEKSNNERFDKIETRNEKQFDKIEKSFEKLNDKVADIEPRKNLEDMAFKQGIRAVEFYMNSKGR